MADEIKGIIDILTQIEQDYTVPRNVRLKISNAISALAEKNKTVAVKIDKSLQELNDSVNDPNIPIYTRTQIWNIISTLEVKNK